MAMSIFNKTGADGEQMAFVDHLEALRWHIVRSLVAVLFFAVLIFIKIDWVFDRVISGPLQNDFVSYIGFCKLSHWLHLGDALCMPPMNIKMQTTEFSSQFMSSITISFMGGFIASFPYIFWEFWRFVKPALKPSEVKHAQGIIFWVSFFFFLGAAFGYFLLGPFTFNFLSNYTIGNSHLLEAKPTLDDYLDNLLNLILGCGIAFELPILSYVLAKIGLISGSFLKKYFKFALVIILVVAAIITPSPDWTSQLIVAIPLTLLYGISIYLATRVEKQRKKEEKRWQ